MMNYGVFSELKKILFEISDLTSSFPKGPGMFYTNTIKYLGRLKTFSEKFNLYFSPDVAITLDKLLVYDGAESAGIVRKNARKQKDAYAVECLEAIYKEIKSFVERDRTLYEECTGICRQLLARALHKGLLGEKSLRGDLDEIIFSVTQDPELQPYYAHVLGQLGAQNTKALLDTVLPQIF